ncbi:6517_t:CDS:2, partial [Entrophospora sp. SA101]
EIYFTSLPSGQTGLRVGLAFLTTYQVLNPNVKLYHINSLLLQAGTNNCFSLLTIDSRESKYYVAVYQKEKCLLESRIVLKNELVQLVKKFPKFLILKDFQQVDFLTNFQKLKSHFTLLNKNLFRVTLLYVKTLNMDKLNHKLDIKPIISTRNFLAEIIQNASNDYEKAGAIQAFEVCYELAKNTIRKILLLRAQEVHITPKEIFRLAALEGLIPDAEYPYTFYAYGSRVKGTARRLSDLDICYQEDIPDNIAFKIEEEFKESDLPFLVELVA